jgi:hypothetical protein
MEINRAMAELIMGALSVCDSEGQSGINVGDITCEDYTKAETDIVEHLHSLYPDVVKKYSWLPVVEKLT